MGKPTICIGENKGADQLRSNCEADQRSAFIFATRIVQFLFYLSAGSDKNHAGDSTWWVTDLADFHLSERF